MPPAAPRASDCQPHAAESPAPARPAGNGEPAIKTFSTPLANTTSRPNPGGSAGLPERLHLPVNPTGNVPASRRLALPPPGRSVAPLYEIDGIVVKVTVSSCSDHGPPSRANIVTNSGRRKRPGFLISRSTWGIITPVANRFKSGSTAAGQPA